MELSSQAFKWMQHVVTALLALTATLLLWQRFGMERVVELSVTQPHEVTVIDDRSEASALNAKPGNSQSTLVTTAHSLRMGCHLGGEFSWPYCKLHFVTGHDGKGIDFSEFDSISFDLSYTGPAPRRIRLFMINHEPNVSTEPQWNSRRFNEMEVEIPAQGELRVPLNLLLQTAGWWKVQAKVPLSQAYARIDNVTEVELSTGTGQPAHSNIDIDLRAIRFHGKWIAKDKLLMWLMSAWIACSLIWMAMGLLHFRTRLANTNKRLELLGEINKALALEARELADQAHTDPLTGALNRQGLREALVKRLQRTNDYSEGLAVLFLDLDCFKQINDVHGHQTGDDVLTRFAAMVRSHVRAGDKLVRWGGEEFLLICPDTNSRQAAVLAEKLRAAMHLQAWPHGLKVTASFGVTALQPGEDLGAAIARADAALYRAKKGGRDRVEGD